MAAPSRTIKIGKYDVIDTIGRGGMGVVYLAKDPYLDRLVAIKMMNIEVHKRLRLQRACSIPTLSLFTS
jgi:serine/threonine protein kinase